MSTPARADDPRRDPVGGSGSGPGHSPPVPAPPGGHALRIDPRSRPAPAPAPLPVVDAVSAGGLVITVLGGEPCAAVTARRNRGGRLEWCLPKGHLEGEEPPEEAAVREIAEET